MFGQFNNNSNNNTNNGGNFNMNGDGFGAPPTTNNVHHGTDNCNGNGNVTGTGNTFSSPFGRNFGTIANINTNATSSSTNVNHSALAPSTFGMPSSSTIPMMSSSMNTNTNTNTTAGLGGGGGGNPFAVAASPFAAATTTPSSNLNPNAAPFAFAPSHNNTSVSSSQPTTNNTVFGLSSTTIVAQQQQHQQHHHHHQQQHQQQQQPSSSSSIFGASSNVAVVAPTVTSMGGGIGVGNGANPFGFSSTAMNNTNHQSSGTITSNSMFGARVAVSSTSSTGTTTMGTSMSGGGNPFSSNMNTGTTSNITHSSPFASNTITGSSTSTNTSTHTRSTETNSKSTMNPAFPSTQSIFGITSTHQHQHQHQHQQQQYQQGKYPPQSQQQQQQQQQQQPTAASMSSSSQEVKLMKLREKIMKKKREFEAKAAAASASSNAAVATNTTTSANANANTNITISAPPIAATNLSNNTDRIPKNKNRNKNRKSPNRNKFDQNIHDKNGNHDKQQQRQQQQQQQQQRQQDDDETKINKSLAEKNALRFTTNNNRDLTSLLPSDLKQRAATTAITTPATAQEENGHETNHDPTNNNGNSISISDDNVATIGSCFHMCPDEELLRREKEGDIQLLEIPHGKIYPPHYTLRDTTVKRFRRSAADYTLNIPSLVRPPAVLEKVCGYLEEWVMERDRQGIDPRFNPNGETICPPPLEVYQFIWDRTRMIRKDFILQNYTGTGGKCNAFAVRCHERIARWHSMCEHQLSHIPDFITMQSQQNIQELGQTMKTLNMYYDDADGRGIVEEDGVGGNNIVTNSIVHGCSSNIIMGVNPKDYDGTPLVNDSSSTSVAKRIIGQASNTNGTAEPEMRGLYILLTINNDGGMEVLKYSARLSEQNSSIFNSRPVQLALKVYKAKREYNYARFFSILRSPSTPYLFACIMFKYVEQMRKAAFRIMSKTFGARMKTGDGVYDAYPLDELVQLLCFEDTEEAKEACSHYNITVKPVPNPVNPSLCVDTIFWRHTDFKEKRDPSKGTILTLQPRKMIRVIESKLNGATRLAVCRGEVSGKGATIDGPVTKSPRKSIEKDARKMLERSESSRKRIQEERIQRERRIAEAQKRAEAERIMKAKIEEKQLKQLEKKKRAREAKEAQENAERQKAKEEEAARKRELEIQRKKQQALEAALKHEAEEKIRLEEERKRQATEQVRLKQEQEHKRQRDILRKAEEERRKKEEIARRVEVERLRQIEIARKAAELRTRQEEEERGRIEEERKRTEDLRIENEWKEKIHFAKKFLLLSRWRENFHAKYGKRIRTAKCLESLDPTQTSHFNQSKVNIGNFRSSREAISRTSSKKTEQKSISCEEFFYQLSCDPTSKFNLPQLLSSVLNKRNFWNQASIHRILPENLKARTTFLFKLGFMVPNTEKVHGQEQLSRMIELWIDSRIDVNQVSKYDCDSYHQVRVVASFIDYEDSIQHCGPFDAIMILVPPACTDSQFNTDLNFGNALEMTVNLDTLNSTEATEFDDMLQEGCEILFNEFVDMKYNLNSLHNCIIERLSLKNICLLLMKEVLWTFPDESNYLRGLPSHAQRSAYDEYGSALVDYCFKSLKILLQHFANVTVSWSTGWPAKDFGDSDNKSICDYFLDREGLPSNWVDFSRISVLEDELNHIFPQFGTLTQLETFLEFLIGASQPEVQGRCSNFYHDRQFRRCLEYAFDCYMEKDTIDHIFYLPIGVTKQAILDTIETSKEECDLNIDVRTLSTIPLLTVLEDESETKREGIIDDSGVYPKQVNNGNDEHQMISFNSSLSHKRSPSKVESDKRPSKRMKQGAMYEDDLKKSRKFTANLKALVDGGTMDMTIGDSSLSKILECIDNY